MALESRNAEFGLKCAAIVHTAICSEGLPPILHHYTQPDAGDVIRRTGIFRAYNTLQPSDDPSEIRYPTRMMLGVQQAFFRDAVAFVAPHASVYRPFIGSFSEIGDDEPLKEQYGEFVLSFRTEALTNARVDNRRPTIGRVEYDPTVQRAAWSQLHALASEFDVTSDMTRLCTLFDARAQLIPFFKSPAWARQQEIRILWNLTQHGNSRGQELQTSPAYVTVDARHALI